MEELDKAIEIIENHVVVLRDVIKSYQETYIDEEALEEYSKAKRKLAELNKLLDKLKKL